jgi:hypothetical protein
MSCKRLIPLTAALLAVAALSLLTTQNAAAGDSVLAIRFDDTHRFTPQTLAAHAGQPLAIKVVNASNETIEFESFKLNREIAMTPGETRTVWLPALSPAATTFTTTFIRTYLKG